MKRYAWVIKIRVLRKVFNKQFLLYQMQETTWLMNRGGIADLPLLGTLLAIFQRSWEPRFLEMMNSFALLPYASFAVSRTFLQQLLTCLNFAFYSEALFCWYKQKKWFRWTVAAAQAAQNHGNEWCFTWYSRWGIYTSISPWIHSLNLTGAAE